MALEIRPERAAALSVDFATGRTAFRDAVSYAIPSQDGVTIDKDREVILVRYKQAVYAFSLSCPHQKTPLRWQEDEPSLQVPQAQEQVRAGWNIHRRQGDQEHGSLRHSAAGQ